MSKGSRPRPYSVSQQEFGNNFDRIFGKNKVTPRVVEDESEVGKCGCGRSPTGKCIGWHSLTEAAFQSKLAEYIAEKEGE